MANRDLRAMQAGEMDPTGEGLTRAGKILGVIVTVLWLAGVLLYCGLGACGLGMTLWGASQGPFDSMPMDMRP